MDEYKAVNNIYKVIKLFSGKMPYAKVGILGEKTNRKDGPVTNAMIGAVHEFGVPERNIPQRSFLRMPISDNLSPKLKELEKEKALNWDALVKITKKIGLIAEAIVEEAFSSNGFGKWKPTKRFMRMFKKTGDINKSGNILVKTRQLRKSISSEVVS